MTVITILPESTNDQPASFRAVSDGKQAVGSTAGQALDAITAELDTGEMTFVIVQRMCPDVFFTEAQQQRLTELMAKWRAARDAGTHLPPAEQAELDDLIKAEVRAAGERAASFLRQMRS